MKLQNSNSFKIKNNHLIYLKKRGGMFILPILELKNLFCIDKTIGYYEKGKKIIIEECDDDRSAIIEHGKLCDAIYNWHKRKSRISIIKSIMKWGVLPFLSAILIISLYTTILQGVAFQQFYFQNQVAHTQLNSAQVPPQIVQSAQQIVQSPEQKKNPIIGTKQLATILEDGTKSGEFTINSEVSSKTKLFVFTDPLCPYWKKLDKVLSEVKSDYSIYLFPINVISNDLVLNNLAEISCEKDVEKKKSLWNSLINDTYASVSPQEKICSDRIEANSNVFRSLRLTGTPAVFNENGVQVPNNVLSDSLSLKNWIKANGQ